MIGFFDSGFGGLTVLREVKKILPQYSYVYLGDNARTPYGSRDGKTIYEFTAEGVRKLFEKGAELIILACNTSSSNALRQIQQEFLPAHFPEKKVLGIIIPTAEEIGRFTHTGEIGVLATEATVASLVYPKEIAKTNPHIKVYAQACPLFVPAIEAGEVDSPVFDKLIEEYLGSLFSQSGQIDAVLLGCTHYATIEGRIKNHLPQKVNLVSQGPIIAQKLEDYLSRHPEIESKLEKRGSRLFLTTDGRKEVETLSGMFYGEPITMETASFL